MSAEAEIGAVGGKNVSAVASSAERLVSVLSTEVYLVATPAETDFGVDQGENTESAVDGDCLDASCDGC